MAFDIKKWLADESAKLGMSETEVAAAEKLLSSDKFKGDFVPLPEFHSQLDRQRTKYEGQLNEVVDLNKQWQDEYDKRYAPALDAIERLEKAGYNVDNLKIDKAGDVTNRGVALTAEDIDKLIDQKVEMFRAGTVDYATFIANKAVEHNERFGKRFDADAYRKFGYENRAKYPTLDSAYEAFTEADRKAKDEADRKAWEKATEERIRLEVSSNVGFPESSGAEGAPAFLASEQKEDVSREANRQAFAKQFHDLKVNI